MEKYYTIFDIISGLRPEYLKTKDGQKDLLAVIVSGNRDKIGTDTIRIRLI